MTLQGVAEKETEKSKPKQARTVPRLRFPGFGGEWQVKRLGQLNIYVSDGNYGELYPKSTQMKSSGVPFIRANNLNDGKLTWRDMKYIAPDLHTILRSGHLRVGDTLVTTRGDIGVTAFVTQDFDDANINAQLCLLRPISGIDNGYLFQSLQTDRSKTQFVQLQTGSALKQLPKGKLAQLVIAVPSEIEQQKVAKFLTVVDERITAIDKKVELLKQYKKGVMQKIFTQQIRFKPENGKDYLAWEQKRLDSVYKFMRTNSLSRDALGDGSGVKNIHYGDVHTKLPLQLDVSIYDLPVIKSSSGIFTDNEYCRANDIVIADASEDYADIGKCIEVKHVNPKEAVAGLHTMLLRPSDALAPGFGGYLFRSDAVRKQIVRIATGVSVLGISKGNMSRLLLWLPSKLEQQKIADFLTAIDDKIKAEEAKLTTAKTFKKSLLQRLFI